MSDSQAKDPAILDGVLTDDQLDQVVGGVDTPLTRPDGLQPGLYVHVIDGLVSLPISGGSHTFSAGQFGFQAPPSPHAPSETPHDSGLRFNPPMFEPGTRTHPTFTHDSLVPATLTTTALPPAAPGHKTLDLDAFERNPDGSYKLEVR